MAYRYNYTVLYLYPEVRPEVRRSFGFTLVSHFRRDMLNFLS